MRGFVIKTIMGKRQAKGIEISHWKVGDADDFQSLGQEVYDDLESAMLEDDDPDQRKEIERPARKGHSRTEYLRDALQKNAERLQN